MSSNEAWRPRAPIIALLLGALLLGMLIVLALASGLFRPGTSIVEPTSSPTSVAASPSPETSLSPATSPSPEPTLSLEPTTSPQPTTTPQPTSSPIATPSPTTATPIPSPAASPLTGWIEVTDFPTYRNSTYVSSITPGGPGFVAVGDGGRQLRGRVWTSPDGLRWTAQPDSQFAGYSLRKVLSVDDSLLAFGRGGQGLSVWRSSDGRNWTQLTEPVGLVGGINDVVAIDGTLIAVGSTGDPDYEAAVWRSSDAVSWQRVASPEGLDELWAVAAKGGTLVTFSRWPLLRLPLMAYSTDLGDNWLPAQTDLGVTDDFNIGLVTVAANDERFVIVGYHELDDYLPIAVTSESGTSWSSVTPPGIGLLGQVVALPGGSFLAIEGWDGGSDARTLVSPDGRSWIERPPLYTDEEPPRPPEGGDEVVTSRVVAAGSAGVVVAQEWGDSTRVWFAPLSVFE